MNLGYLAGASPRDVAPAIAYNLLSTSCCIGAASMPTAMGRYALLAAGGSFTVMATRAVVSLPAFPTSVGYTNKMRCRTAGDMMIFGWTIYPLVELAGFADIIPVPGQLHVFALLDVL